MQVSYDHARQRRKTNNKTNYCKQNQTTVPTLVPTPQHNNTAKNVHEQAQAHQHPQPKPTK